jgi:hypothetical protein
MKYFEVDRKVIDDKLDDFVSYIRNEGLVDHRAFDKFWDGNGHNMLRLLLRNEPMNCDKTCRDTYVCEGKKGSFCKMEIGKSENPIYNYIPFFFKFNRQIITANIQKNFAKRLEFFLYFIHKNAYDEWKRLSRKEREFAERNIDGFDLEKLKNVPEEPELSIEDHRSDPWVKFTKKLKQEERNVELNRVFGFMPSRSISSSEEGESEPTGGPEDSVDKVDSEVRSEPESTVLFERGLAPNSSRRRTSIKKPYRNNRYSGDE